MNKKGFTLIELLAVIVILAAIALITVPTILGVIERARKGAAESSALGYIDAIEKQIALDSVEGIIHQDKDDYVYDEIEVSIKGSIPTGGIYTLNSNKVTAGTFCINNYIVEYSENKAKASTKCTGEDLKLTGSVKLSKSSTNISYPNTDTFEVIENKSGGNLTCETSDSNVATCSIKDKVVTVKSGKKEGNATLTIKSEGSSKYKEATAAFVVVTSEGLLTVNANDYSELYDGLPHGIIVSCEGAQIKYGIEEGNYSLDESPTRTDIGTTTVYYQVTKDGYKTVAGSKKIEISKSTLIVNDIKGFKNITDALAYIGDSTAVIKLVDNISESIVISKGNITMDINQKSIFKVIIVNGGTLNIKNGTVDTTAVNGSTGIYVDGGTLNVVDGTYKGNHDAIYVRGGKAIINSGTFSSSKYGAVCANGGIAIINNGTFNGGTEGCTLVTQSGSLTFNNGTVNTSDGKHAICNDVSQTSTTNINGGTITGSFGGIYIAQGTVNVNGGTIKGISNDGISIAGGNTYIKGGTISGNYYGIAMWENTNGNVIVTGGTITSSIYDGIGNMGTGMVTVGNSSNACPSLIKGKNFGIYYVTKGKLNLYDSCSSKVQGSLGGTYFAG